MVFIITITVFLLDSLCSNQVNWIVLSIKQFGAKGDSTAADQNAINSAFSFADSYQNKDRAIIYLPAGEYKACNQIQANASNINLVGEGDNSIIFTDNDICSCNGICLNGMLFYKRRSSFQKITRCNIKLSALYIVVGGCFGFV